jgi:hypothetical protein
LTLQVGPNREDNCFVQLIDAHLFGCPAAQVAGWQLAKYALDSLGALLIGQKKPPWSVAKIDAQPTLQKYRGRSMTVDR